MSGEKWKIKERSSIYVNEPWMKIENHTVELPDGKVVENYHRLVMPGFSVIYAVTTDGNVILVRLYRHGIEDFTLDLPAGMVEKNEEPLAAAKRELLEETGYIAKDWTPLGTYALHANYGCGTAHIFRADGARKIQEPDHGDLEEITVLLAPEGDVATRLRRGEFKIVTSATAISMAQWLGAASPEVHVSKKVVPKGTELSANGGLIVNVDGGARGNPGMAACGFVVSHNDEELHRGGRFLGIATNNEAEYDGLLMALKWLDDNNCSAPEIRMDSTLVVNQVEGRWKIKSPNLRDRAIQARKLAILLKASFRAVPREQNSSADAEVNRILDEKASRP